MAGRAIGGNYFAGIYRSGIVFEIRLIVLSTAWQQV